MSIRGALFTRTRQVTLRVAAPDGARSVTISSDGGYGDGQEFPITAMETDIPWTVHPPVMPQQPVTVYVDFGAAGHYTDDIVLDSTPPAVGDIGVQSTTTAMALSMTATDNQSGVDKVQVVGSSGTAIVPYSTKIPVPLKPPSIAAAAKVTYPAAGSARLAWGPPANLGNPANVTCRVRITGKNNTVYGPEKVVAGTAFTFTGLAVGATCRVQITTVNAAGPSVATTVTVKPTQ